MKWQTLLHSEDLAELVYKVFNSWTDEIEVLTIPSPFQDTFFQQLATATKFRFLAQYDWFSNHPISYRLYQTMDKNNLRSVCLSIILFWDDLSGSLLPICF